MTLVKRIPHSSSLIIALFLASCGVGGGDSNTGFIPEAQAARPVPPPPTQINGWYAGPIIGTFNYSSISLMPPVGSQVLQFDLPVGQEVDALARPVTALPVGLTISYELLGTAIPSGSATEPALISIAFQRKGDTWSGKNVYQQYRWYAQASQVLVPGTNTFTVDFTSGAWSDVYGIPASAHPAEFAAAKANVETVYITFGFSAGRMHGVLGPAHFNLLSATFFNP